MRKRGSSAYHSFSNGNAGPEGDQWSGNPIRPIHWWHWA